jgi:hypothetical protein
LENILEKKRGFAPCLRGLKYSPQSGVLYRNKKKSRGKAGAVGFLNSHGYLSIIIDGSNWFIHRLAFYFMGDSPDGYIIDHVNGIRTDNRLSNLRKVSKSQNNLNKSPHRRGKIPYINKSNTKGKWIILCKGKYYGTFTSQETAFKKAQELGLYE